MRNLLIKCLAIVFLLLPSVVLGYESIDGGLRLADLLKASPLIAKSTPQALVNKAIPGSIVTINGTEYEVRYFSFEDVSGKLPADIKFENYIENNHLLEMPSAVVEPVPGLKFEAFDFRKANLKDGIYFSMALKEIKKRK